MMFFLITPLLVVNGVYSDTIEYHKVTEPNEATTLTNENTRNSKVNLVEEHNVNDFIKSVDAPALMSTNRPYIFVGNKYNATLDVTGSLYRASETQTIKKFMFDYSKDTAISVIAAAVTSVFGLAIVTITVLLTELGIGVYRAFTTTALNGFYNATRYDYWYKVYVDGKVTYEHAQHQVDVQYNNTNNNKQLIRSSQSLSWASENAIMNTGIFAGAK